MDETIARDVYDPVDGTKYNLKLTKRNFQRFDEDPTFFKAIMGYLRSMPKALNEQNDNFLDKNVSSDDDRSEISNEDIKFTQKVLGSENRKTHENQSSQFSSYKNKSKKEENKISKCSPPLKERTNSDKYMFDGTNLEQDSLFELFSDDSSENSETPTKSQMKVLQNNTSKKKGAHSKKNDYGSEEDDDETGHDSKNKKWNKPMTLLLLNAYEDNKERFNNPNISVSKNWRSVAKVMQENGYASIDSEDCRKKFNYLKTVYKKTKDHNGKSGRQRKNFEYYKEMDRICQDDVWVAPKATASSEKWSDEENSFIDEDTPRRKKQKTISTEELLRQIIGQNEVKIKQKDDQIKQKQQIGEQLCGLLSKLIEKS